MTHGINREILIVGGSLSGLTFALACANRGVRTRVLERAIGQHRSGAALGIDRATLTRTIGFSDNPGSQSSGFPVLTNIRKAAAWSDIHGWLREQVYNRGEITLIEGCAVQNVAQSTHGATVTTEAGEQIAAPVVVGADGYRSLVRATIDPANPRARYAGYVLWRGLVEEREMPKRTLWPSNDGVALVNIAGYRLVAYPVAGRDGSLEPRRRRISFTWYDPTRTALLEELRCVSATRHVLGSLSKENVPDAIRLELRELAERIWPSPWRDCIIHAVDQRGIFATPVAEFVPEHLQHGRFAIVGDAAHVVSPLTGMGFVAGTVDASVLAECLGRVEKWSFKNISLALTHYENTRLQAARELASTSVSWSRAYLETVDFRRVGQNWPLRPL